MGVIRRRCPSWSTRKRSGNRGSKRRLQLLGQIVSVELVIEASKKIPPPPSPQLTLRESNEGYAAKRDDRDGSVTWAANAPVDVATEYRGPPFGRMLRDADIDRARLPSS